MVATLNIYEILRQLSPDVVYVITYTTERTKRSITGKYVSSDLTEVILLDEKGKFKKAPIDKIIRINFYHEAPF